MGDQMEKALVQLKNKEEAGLNYLYSKTYNYVYLRAKSILRKEEDVQKLMKEVYRQAFAAAGSVKENEIYEWLGKRTYELGNKQFRRKKAREATHLEVSKNELSGHKNGSEDVSEKVLIESLGNLPDLYQATLYAFYYDFMSITDIAEVMDCDVEVILYRLNYTVKFIKEAFAIYNEENGKDKKASFSIEVINSGLRKWSVEHCLGMASAQTLYASLCKELELKAGSIYLEGKEFAGVNNTVVFHKGDDFEPILAEIDLYSHKESFDKKKAIVVGGIVAAVLIVILACAALFGGKDEKDPKEPETQTEVELEDTTEDVTEDTTEEVTEDTTEEATEESEDEVVLETETEEAEVSGDYILPASNEKELTEADLQGLTKEQLRLARNEIYARHGMIFGVQDLDDYFAAKSWYEPKYRSDDFYDNVEMNSVEEKNVQFILKIEQSM